MTEFDITCLPKDLPEYIAIDVSNLGINESIHLSEVTLPEGVEFTSISAQEGDDPTVATITPPKVIEEEEVVEEGEEALGEEAEDAGEEGAAEPAHKSGWAMFSRQAISRAGPQNRWAPRLPLRQRLRLLLQAPRRPLRQPPLPRLSLAA